MTRSLSQCLIVATAALSLAACADKKNSPSPMEATPAPTGTPSSMSSNDMGSGSASASASQDSTEDMLQRVQMIHVMEIQAGKMAKAQGSNQKVKDFGDKLVRDHEQGQQRLQQLAQQKGIALSMNEPTMMRGTDATHSTTPSGSGSGSMATGSTTATGTTGSTSGSHSGSHDASMMGMPADMQASMAAMERLKTMKGKEFDSAFMRQMVKDHEQALMMIQSFQTRVQGDAAIQQELQTLTASIKAHRDMAQTIVSSLGGASPDRVNTSGSSAPSQPSATTTPSSTQPKNR